MKKRNLVALMMGVVLLSSCGETCYECTDSNNSTGIKKTLCESDFGSEEKLEEAVNNLEAGSFGVMKCTKK